MSGPLENRLQIEREYDSRLGRLRGALEGGDADASELISRIQDRASDHPEERGIGAGMLLEQRRARAWKLALAAAIGLAVLRMLYESVGGF